MELTIFERRGQLYADSREVAQMVGKSHKKLLRDIRTYIDHLNRSKIGPVDFFVESDYRDEKGERRPCYDITRKGCDLIAHKLTGIKGTAFSASYINRFYDMERTLMSQSLRWQQLRLEGKPIRRTLTDAIRDSGEDEQMHGHAYSTYTDLAYKWATGKIARVLRAERGAVRRAVATDFLSAEEMERYNIAEGRITVLLDMGLRYGKIKELMMLRITDTKAS